MMKKSHIAIMLASVLMTTYGCQHTKAPETQTVDGDNIPVSLPDFESDSFFNNVAVSHAKVEKINGVGVTAGSNALKISFDEVSEANKFKFWPNIKIVPNEGIWNWNSKGSFKVDVTNPSDSSANIIFKVVDNIGSMGAQTNQLNYAVSIPAGETETVEMLFNGGKRKLNNYWDGDQLDLRKLVELQVFVQGPMDAQTVVLDNFELIDATGDFISAKEQVIDVGPVPTVKVITDFDSGEASYISERSVSTSVKTVDTAEGQGIEVRYSSENAYPNLTLAPTDKWDWSKEQDFNLAFDIENPTNEPIQMFVRVDQAENKNWGGTADGVTDSMSAYMTLAPQEMNTYYMSLSQLSGKLVSGMRSEPPKKSYNAQKISYGWGETELDLSNIKSIQLYLQNPTKDTRIILDSVRLIPNLDADATRYAGLVDEFGQSTHADWPEKIDSIDELQAQGKKDLESLKTVQPLPDRSTFGGWKDGPKLDATGFFRTEKVDGQWSLVDPEGYLFFMTGLDNVRMDDTVTITGVDYENPDERSGRSIPSELRNSMFTWLPEDDDPLASNYDYATYVHSGALKKGEVFSFYRANLMRKYDTSKEEAMKIWKDVTLERMQEWGFTTLGNWIDPMFYDNGKVAYEAHGWIAGDHQRISTGNDYWGPIHDPFDPKFQESTRKMAERVASKVSDNDPWLVGTFVDNEISWGNVMNEANHYGLIINALSYDAEKSSAKQSFTTHLKSKYKIITALNKAWGTKVGSWGEFEKSFDYREKLKPGMKADYSELLQMLGEQYFSIVRKEIKRVLPNHLYLGARFSDWGLTPEIARAAAKHVDVMSYNLYANDITDEKKAHFQHFLAELDMPSMIGEFHFGSTDSGLYHGGIVNAASQSERASMYTRYMESVIDNPYFVGAHWFQYLDSPATGRAWDGENYNIGFVTIADQPYEELVEAAKQVNINLYQQRFSK